MIAATTGTGDAAIARAASRKPLHAAPTASRERSDTTAVPAASIVMLAMTALVLANALLEKFGEDTIREIQERVVAHRTYVDSY